jgi:hypothetical protein
MPFGSGLSPEPATMKARAPPFYLTVYAHVYGRCGRRAKVIGCDGHQNKTEEEDKH